MKSIRALVLAVAFLLTAAPTMAAPAFYSQAQKTAEPPELRLDTPSGLPVPRFVSLKAARTYCRAGPTFAHPVRITFMRQGLPVMVVAETRDHWRKVRDPEGDECWIHKTKLSGAETALVLEEGLMLRLRPSADAPEKARLGRGLITRVEKISDGWLRVSTDGVRGWAPAAAFWGVFPQPPSARSD